MIGLGMNWSEPADESLEAQTVYELFYRVQLSPRLAITPSLQFVDDPALPDAPDDHLWFYGLRGRFTF
jgi:porin